MPEPEPEPEQRLVDSSAREAEPQAALLSCLRHDGPIVLSLSAKEGTAAPTLAEWDELLAQLSL